MDNSNHEWNDQTIVDLVRAVRDIVVAIKELVVAVSNK